VKFEKHEWMGEGMKSDLPQRSFEFAKRVVNLCRLLDESPGVSRTLARQILRSGTSIGANIEEAQASQSEADFVSKYSIACKEARQTHCWLRLLSACAFVPENRLEPLLNECHELIAILTTIIKKLRAKKGPS
jgi:four helix bundle protein